jgi:hypothetical protein
VASQRTRSVLARYAEAHQADPLPREPRRAVTRLSTAAKETFPHQLNAGQQTTRADAQQATSKAQANKQGHLTQTQSNLHGHPPKLWSCHKATRPAVNGSALNDSTLVTAKQAHAPPITKKLRHGKIATEKHTGTQRTSTTVGKLQKQQPPKSITSALRATQPQNPQQQKKEHAGLVTTKPNKRRCTRNNDHTHPKITNYFQSEPRCRGPPIH